MVFYKTVSAGNDFLQVDLETLGPGSDTGSRLARRLCDRETGPGSDGVVYYRNSPGGADFEIFNRDGSEAEISGNGMAGCAALLFYLELFEERIFLETKAGKKEIRLIERDNNGFTVNVEIGEPDFRNLEMFPFLEEGTSGYLHRGIKFYPVSVGNPHAVVILENETSDSKLMAMGKMLEQAEIFPRHTNVELAAFEGEEKCRVFYYERGVGRTLSSSTGSAAVFAVLQRLHLITDRLTIDSPGGSIKIFHKGRIFVENFTKIVYKGIYFY